MSSTEIEARLRVEKRPKLQEQIERLKGANFDPTEAAVPFIPYVGHSYADSENSAGEDKNTHRW